jgi:peroxiredoxin
VAAGLVRFVSVLASRWPTTGEADVACKHLTGACLPSQSLPATTGDDIDLSKQPGMLVVYIYPRTGRPDQEPPIGWNEIPGARSCTPQSCAFRDHYAEIRSLGAAVYGLSTEDTDYQRDAVERLHLPFLLLSADELTDRICAVVDCTHEPYLSLTEEVA